MSIFKKSTTFRTALVLLALACLNPAWAGPRIQHWVADNGTQVYFVESRALPLIDIEIAFTAGSAYDPEGKSGTASMTRDMLQTGALDLDEQQIAERIADTGAQFGGSVDNDRSAMTVRTLSSADERDAAVALAARLLAHPAFPADAFGREKTRTLAAVRDALTRPAVLAERAFSRAIYGSHPYADQSGLETVERITRDDLVTFHRRHYVTANATVTIIGDASREDAERIALALTRELPAGTRAPELAQPALPERSLERIAHPSAQSHILVGMPGLSREDPDYYPLLVGNYILGGGGFVSRLTEEVREKRGLAYSVYSHFNPLRVAGPFQIGLQTRGQQADEALGVVEQVLAGFIAEGPTAAELQAARDNIVNGFGLRLDSNAKLLGYVAMIGFYRLPLDWLDTYTDHVSKVTPAAVRDAFARRIKPRHLATVIVGGDGDNARAQAGTADGGTRN
ncbi:MAG: insulinase family protein [Rhodocyclales bacterium]|nr:insulinase family protein [Rhodocyclales bacterium]